MVINVENRHLGNALFLTPGATVGIMIIRCFWFPFHIDSVECVWVFKLGCLVACIP